MDFKISLCCGVLLVFAIISQTTADDDEKKFKFVLDKLDKVKEAEHILITDLTFDKVGDEDVKINGQMDQLVPLDNDYKLNMDIMHSTEKDGEYKKVIGFAKLGVCNVMSNQYKKFFYDTLKEHSNAPDPDKCPVTKETYIVKDYPLDSSKFKKYLRLGFYKVVCTLFHTDEEVLQYIVEGHTEEE